MSVTESTREHVAAVQHLWYGHDHVPARTDFEFAWKAIKAVAAGDGVLSPPERLHLLGKMCAILTPADIVEEVMRFDEHSEKPERLLDRIQVPDEVRPGTGAWIVYEGLSVASADGELAPAELERASAASPAPCACRPAWSIPSSASAATRQRRARAASSSSTRRSRRRSASATRPPIRAGRPRR